MIIWINGTHGVGKTTTSALVAPLLPNARVFDADYTDYAEAARTWLHRGAEVIDTTDLDPERAAAEIVASVSG